MKRTPSQEASYRDKRLRQKKECKEISKNQKKQEQQRNEERLRRLHEQTYASRENKQKYTF